MKVFLAGALLVLLVVATAGRELQQVTISTSTETITSTSGGTGMVSASTSATSTGTSTSTTSTSTSTSTTRGPAETEEENERLDVYCLVDLTEKSTKFVRDLARDAKEIVNSIFELSPLVRFGVGTYSDVDGKRTFENVQSVTKLPEKAATALSELVRTKGGEKEECQFHALKTVATAEDYGFREKSIKIIVWLGDAPAKETCKGSTIDDVIDALDENFKIVALDFADLDKSGQATDLVLVTDGILLKANEDGEFTPAALSQSAQGGATQSSTSATGDNISVRTVIDGEVVESSGPKKLADAIVDSVAALF